jgi:Holliday junction resolvasome RuvABC endonuclease subunit
MARILSIDPGRKNLGLCVIRADENDRSGMRDAITFWRVVEISTDVAQLKRILDDILKDVAYDVAVIERQPPKNSTMKRFEHLFEMYCSMHGTPVYVIDARHKLTFASRTPHWPGGRPIDAGKDKGSWSYVKRKKIAVAVVTKFLAETDHAAFQELFDKAQKKDDYADALLQAQAYAHTVRYAEADKMAAHVPKVRPFPKPRAPKPGGRVTKANVAFHVQACETVDEIETTLADNVKVRNALTTFFGSPETFLHSRVAYEEKKRRQASKTVPCPSQPPPSTDLKRSLVPSTNAM